MSVSSIPFCSSTKTTNFPSKTAVFPPYLLLHLSKFTLITCFCRRTDDSNHGAELVASRMECESRDFYENDSLPTSISGVNVRSAPWMNGPLGVRSNRIPGFKNPRKSGESSLNGNGNDTDLALTGKVGGGRGRLAMKKIFKGIQKLQEKQDFVEVQKQPKNVKFKFGPNDLWGVGSCAKDVEKVGERSEVVQEMSQSFYFDLPLAEIENGGKFKNFPWERDEEMTIMVKKGKVSTAAELSLDSELLERLKLEAAMLKKWVKVKKAGITQSVVDQVITIWRSDELALIKFDLPLCRNMERAREIVEVKTGGLVVWSNKDLLAVFRGCNYGASSQKKSKNMIDQNSDKQHTLLRSSLYEREADRLLDGLGPRFVDWWMPRPLPVDADLLPEYSPGLKTPFRLRPPSTRSKLTDAELTYLRKIARPIPTHFVLGRNRKLHGLAIAILKLWEKCHIAKIALKWGVPNTSNEQMANELKNLTGGDLLLRNKFIIILYRGKDFVPSKVASLVAERETELTKFHIQEEDARLKASEGFSISNRDLSDSDSVGTLSEFQVFQSKVWNLNMKTETEVKQDAERGGLEKELKIQQRKHFILTKKINKSSKMLGKLNSEWKYSEQDMDQEIISQEERECLPEMGLKMDSSLVLGRRGIFDGVIEGMHQHWKHREVVKVITKQKKVSQVLNSAKFLEAESGGILVAVLKLKEEHAIIVYRGKNYNRPNSMPQNLLNKRKAMSRSIEMQRLGSLKFFAYQRKLEIDDLESKLADLQKR